MTKASERVEPTEWEWPGTGLAGLIYFGLAAAFFLPAFLPGNHLYGSDYLAAGYFSHEFISERLADGALPKWVPHIYGGVPWFANPGSTYYPFRFVVDLLFAPHRIFAAFYVIQFTLAGIGTYLLARELDVRRWAAFVGGLAFMFTGLVVSYILAGHEGRIIVATFTPLFLFFLHRGVRTGGAAWFGGAALTLGFSLLSFQIQSNYYLLLLGAAWGVFALVRCRVRGPRPLAGRLALGLGAVAAGFLMAAINFLPFLGYVDASPRAGEGRGYEYATSWDMPPAEITGLVLPEQAGLLELYQGANPFKLHMEYVGAVVLLLVVLAAYYGRRDRYVWFFAATAIIGLTFSFGGHTPVYRLYYALLPGTEKFRSPSISFFVVSFALVMIATLGLEALARVRAAAGAGAHRAASGRGRGAGGKTATAQPARAVGARAPGDAAVWLIGAVVGLALIILVLAGGTGTATEHGRALARGAFRLFFVTGLAGATLWAWLGGRLPTRAAVLALTVLTVTDLWIVDRRFFRTVDAPRIMMAPDEVVEFLRGQPERFRVWSLPPMVPGQQEYGGGLRNYLMRFDIDQAGGEHGNQLQSYNQYVGAGETTYVDWHNFMADLQGLVDPSIPTANPRPNFLAGANVRYIVSTIPLPGLPERFRGRTGIVYEVEDALPRAFLVGSAVTAAPPDGGLEVLRSPEFDPASTVVVYEPIEAPLPGTAVSGRARIVAYEPDRVAVNVRADSPALLVLADNFYPGWEATVDGEAAPIHRANHTFRAVPVPAGEHEVVFRFRPAEFYLGAWISLLSFLALIAVVAVVAWRHRTALRSIGAAPAGG